MPPDLEIVMDVPTTLMYLWEWLCEHTYPMSFVELESWQRLTGRKLDLWEIRAMVELDKVRSYG